MRIIFMGTPDFAVPCLDILVKNGYDIAAVVTATDKPGGRRGLIESAVKKYAIKQNLKVLQPEKLKNAEFVAEMQSLNADLQVVVAFRMLPEVIWNMPRLGTMNLHGSLLPKYRGAAPIHWAVMNGEEETGCTTFILQHKIDTGDLLYQAKMSIGSNETTGEVHDRMMLIGADLVLKSVQDLEAGRVVAQPQSGEATHAPKLFTETCEIDWTKPAEEVHNFIRGLSPFPCAWTSFQEKNLKVYHSLILDPEEPALEAPGTFVGEGKKQIKVATGQGYVYLEELQLEGKRRMSAADFRNGNEI